jgi:hypothetical protein
MTTLQDAIAQHLTDDERDALHHSLDGSKAHWNMEAQKCAEVNNRTIHDYFMGLTVVADTLASKLGLPELDDLYAAPAGKNDAQKVAVLLAALKEWKCPGCGGRGEYEHHGQKQEFERTGRVRLPHPHNKVTDCKKCNGSGLHPTAAAAIKEIETP